MFDYDKMITNDIPAPGQSLIKDENAPWLGIRKKGDSGTVQVSSFGSMDYGNYQSEQGGTGIGQYGGNIMSNSLSMSKKILEQLPSAIEQVDQVMFGPIGSAVSNTISEYYNKNPEYQPVSAGEKHLVLPTPYGLTRANFAGPGTHLDKRLARGDRGVDGPLGIDEAARQHDIDYANAKNYNDIRRADTTFINAVDRSNQLPWIKKVVKGAMRAKKFAEDAGIVGKDRYLTQEQKESFSGSGMKGGKKGKKSYKLPNDRLEGSKLKNMMEDNHKFEIVRDERVKAKGGKKYLTPAQMLRAKYSEKPKKEPKKRKK